MNRSSKIKLPAYYLIAFAIFGTLISSCKGKPDSNAAIEYTCPMHPQIIRDKPGSCPICKMDLVKEEKPKKSSQLEHVELNQLTNVKTVTIKKMAMKNSLKSQGVITYDPRYATVISSRITGRIEKLYVKYLNQSVSQGQKLFEVYSPELTNAQRELIYLTKNDATNSDMIQSAKEKLNLLGVDKNQIEKIAQSGKEIFLFTIFSPVNGHLVSAESNLSSEEKEINIREGNYVEAGKTVLKIVSSTQVWAEFNIKQKDIFSIKQGSPLVIKNNREEINVVANFIQPFYKEGEEFLKVRSYLSNSKLQFKIGELVEAEFTIDQKSNWLPLSSVVDMGVRKIVYVKIENQFEAREVQTGNANREWVEIRKGLSPSDQVAATANYITDSESFIKVN